MESELSCQVNQVVDSVVAISPKHDFSSFKIHESGSKVVGVDEFLFYLCVCKYVRVLFFEDATMFAFQVAFVSNEEYGL